jgi:hypothetical protein
VTVIILNLEALLYNVIAEFVSQKMYTEILLLMTVMMMTHQQQSLRVSQPVWVREMGDWPSTVYGHSVSDEIRVDDGGFENDELVWCKSANDEDKSQEWLEYIKI